MSPEVTIIPHLRRVIYDTYANFPTTGLKVEDLAYATDRLILYRWSGSAWQIISQPSISLPNATQPVNSKGNSFATIQAALNDLAGNGWVYVPEGTYNEALMDSNNNVILFGAGWSTIIDGGTTGNAIEITGASCVVRDLIVKTTQGGGNDFDGIHIPGVDGLISNVLIDGCDSVGIHAYGARCRIISCYVRNIDSHGIYLGQPGGDSLVVANIIKTTGGDGIYIHLNAENNIVVANRITGWGVEAIDDDSGTSIVANNNTT